MAKKKENKPITIPIFDPHERLVLKTAFMTHQQRKDFWQENFGSPKKKPTSLLILTR